MGEPESASDGLVLAVDLGGTHLRAGLIDGEMKVHRLEIEESRSLLDSGNPCAALVSFLENYIARSDLDVRELRATSIGIPGTIDRARRRIVSVPSGPSLAGAALADYVESRLRVPSYLDRDVNMLLRHDMVAMNLPVSGVVIGCYFGTGIGNAICIDGEILVGAHGVSGELGHIPIYGADRRCGCGNRGCIEMFASGRSLERIAEESFPRTALRDVFTLHGAHPLLEHFVKMMALGVAVEVSILDPAVVVLGGGLLRMGSFPTGALVDEIRQRSRRPLPALGTVFVVSKGGHEAGLIGAAIYVNERQSMGRKDQSSLGKVDSS